MYSIYLINDEEFYKIGYSSAVSTRKHSLQTGNPRILTVLHTVTVAAWTDAKLLEESLHNKFSSKKQRGEWYTLDKEDVTYIQNIPEVAASNYLKELHSSTFYERTDDILRQNFKLLCDSYTEDEA